MMKVTAKALSMKDSVEIEAVTKDTEESVVTGPKVELVVSEETPVSTCIEN